MALDTLFSPFLTLRSDNGQIEKKYLQLSNDIFINDYIQANDAFLQYAINVVIPNKKKTFIPFFHIALNNKEQSKRARERMVYIRDNNILEYTFANIVDDLKCECVRVVVNSRGKSKITYVSPNVDASLKRKVEANLNHPNSFAYYLWADECLFNKPKELFYEIISIESINSNQPSTIIVVSTKRTTINDFIEEKKWQLLTIIDAIKSVYIYNQARSLQKESLKSAVSAIMTRNMSHNLGSHYLHYTKTQLENLAKRGGEFGPDIRGAAKVMEYMQGRMDYLATLISGDRYPYGCVNFKSQIYDMLTIDDFSKRHFKKDVNKTLGKEYDDMCDIIDEIYDNNFEEKIIKEKIPSIYEITSKMRSDTSYNRTTNFLLTNLILSEGFTRSEILEEEDSKNTINIHVRYADEVFTGSSAKNDEEQEIKEKLSKINIAMPGGIMSCHAFFNVIENFIRNSAKYHQADFQRNKEPFITTTIAIKEKKENNLDVYEFTIFDNKQNAGSHTIYNRRKMCLINSINERLKKLCVLDENNAVEKSNKGFKEMLFSTIWMRTFVFMQEEKQNSQTNYSDILATIQSAPNGTEKLKLIRKYGFSVIAVDDKGNKCTVKNNKYANLALRFTLPKFKKNVTIELPDNTNINPLLNVYGDVVYVDKEKIESLVNELNGRLQSRFAQKIRIDKDLVIPRNSEKEYNDKQSIRALEEVLYKRFGKEKFNKYAIAFGSDEYGETDGDEHRIYFQRHLSSQVDDMSRYKNYAYADSISGGDFTITLSEVFAQWAKKGYKTDIPEYYDILKIKESALTRITLIDERLYDEMVKQKIQTELSCKNIRILNYYEQKSKKKFDEFEKLFIGNEFNHGGGTTHFLSIHLGLIEKIIQDSKNFKSMKDESGKKYGEYSEQERTIIFMNLLKKHFGDNNQKVFISIHSGRGNFSAELDGPLAIYPFIGMAAIENAYNNSKYLLSQLFYSTIYLGKGIANKH